MALQPRERAGAAAGGIRRAERPGAQGGPGVGDQRGVAGSLVLHRSGIRLEVLEAVVLLCDPQPTGTDAQGSRNDPPAYQEHPDL